MSPHTVAAALDQFDVERELDSLHHDRRFPPGVGPDVAPLSKHLFSVESAADHDALGWRRDAHFVDEITRVFSERQIPKCVS